MSLSQRQMSMIMPMGILGKGGDRVAETPAIGGFEGQKVKVFGDAQALIFQLLWPLQVNSHNPKLTDFSTPDGMLQ
jgi:hypothetical protein